MEVTERKKGKKQLLPGGADESLAAEADALAVASGRKKRAKFEYAALTGAKGLTAVRRGFVDNMPKFNGDEAKFASNLVGQVRRWCKDMFPGMNYEDLLMRVEAFGSVEAVKDQLQLMRSDELKAFLTKIHGEEEAEAIISGVAEKRKREEEMELERKRRDDLSEQNMSDERREQLKRLMAKEGEGEEKEDALMGEITPVMEGEAGEAGETTVELPSDSEEEADFSELDTQPLAPPSEEQEEEQEQGQEEEEEQEEEQEQETEATQPGTQEMPDTQESESENVQTTANVATQEELVEDVVEKVAEVVEGEGTGATVN